jgi:periplasmic protein TonB
MSTLAISFRMPRQDNKRWGICFAVVVAAHAAAVLALLINPSSDSDFGVDAPVVTIELPESLVTAATPPTDLAPGPKEEESEATPPPKEETKPLEQEAEVALPTPPKPEPPQEAKQATAPPAAAPSVAVVHRWESELVAHIERFKRYPAEARAHDERGVARVAFSIDHDGRIVASRIVQSSGSTALDTESLEMLARAQPMPRPPAALPNSELSFVVLVRFNIR